MEAKKKGRPVKELGKFEEGGKVVDVAKALEHIKSTFIDIHNVYLSRSKERSEQGDAKHSELNAKIDSMRGVVSSIHVHTVAERDQIDEAIREVKQSVAQIKDHIAARGDHTLNKHIEADKKATANFNMLAAHIFEVDAKLVEHMKYVKEGNIAWGKAFEVLSENDETLMSELKCVAIFLLGNFILSLFVVYKLLTCL